MENKSSNIFSHLQILRITRLYNPNSTYKNVIWHTFLHLIIKSQKKLNFKPKFRRHNKNFAKGLLHFSIQGQISLIRECLLNTLI